MDNIHMDNCDNEFFLSCSDEKINENFTPKIIFIVPYRDREQQLLFFQRHMQYILEDYNINDCKIIIVHQYDKRSFNCGAMKNIGFLIVKDLYPETYQNITLIFNDVDTMPFNKNFLTFETRPGIVKHFYGFKHTLGGIVSINAKDFEKINGFPNFWAWGYEDNLLYERIKKNRLAIDRNQFFPFADKNILHFYDGYLKQVNKKEFDRYVQQTTEGIHSIYNLQYVFNDETNTYDITSFETGINEDIRSTKMHDLHKGTTPFNHIRSGRGATIGMRL
tara:strand:+ start:1081 stop:1911 length:831 start_codon:yes stop_codon:yes gene_type:complete